MRHEVEPPAEVELRWDDDSAALGRRADTDTRVSTDAAATVLFAFGYPTAIVVILRFVPVVRERRMKWLVAHDLAVAAIVAGWALKGDGRAVAINAVLARRRQRLVRARRPPPRRSLRRIRRRRGS